MSLIDELRGRHFSDRLRRKDPSLWTDDPRTGKLIASRLGWLTVHRSMLASVAELQELAGWVRELDFSAAVLIGMGGSSLAPEVFSHIFGPADGFPPLHVIDSTDPTAILRLENRIDIETTLFIVSSKSGTTIETVCLQRYFAERMRDASGDTGALDNFIAITDPDTPLHHQAREEGYHRVFVNPPDIGGRYSALSFFGLVPAAVLGVDVERLLLAANAVDFDEGVALGARIAELAEAGRDKLTFLPSADYDAFGAWAEQLIAESTGKDGKGIIPVDGEPLGAPAVYGDDRVFVYIGDGGLPGAAAALAKAGHPVIHLAAGDRYNLGREFLRWEIATATIGAALGINPFDEPDVQESKDNTRRVLEEYVRSGSLPGGDPAAEEEGFLLYAGPETQQRLSGAGERIAQKVAALLRTGGPGRYAAVLAYTWRSEEHDRALASLRLAIRDATRMATTVGYGPRYLHSTGQLHKGGPPSGIFILITADDPADEDIPGESGFGFSTLKAAQAIGDLQALESRGLPVLRIHITGEVTEGLAKLAAAVAEDLSPRTAVAQE